MTTWQAGQMPDYRRGIISYAERDLAVMLRAHHAGGEPVRMPWMNGRPVSYERYAQMMIRWASQAELYFVTEPMTAVVRQAAHSLPHYRFLKQDMPAPIGLLVWATSVAEPGPAAVAASQDPRGTAAVQVMGALWAPASTPEGPGVHVALFSDAAAEVAASAHFADLTEDERRLALRMMGPLAYYDEVPLSYGVEDRGVGNQGIAAVMSTWLIMGQRIAVVQHDRLSRQIRRQAARAGEPEPLVRTITLRRPAKTGRADNDGQGPRREYHHQWIVHGFWRDQWYPSEQRHKPIYIADFVKGPAGAPMLGGERVSVLRR